MRTFKAKSRLDARFSGSLFRTFVAITLIALIAACGGGEAAEEPTDAVDEATPTSEATPEDTGAGATDEATEDAATEDQAAEYPDEFTVGFILPLSGAPAAQGEQFRRGAELAVEEINEAGGVGGVMLNLVFEDHQTLPDQAVTAANKLIHTDGAQVIVNSYTSPVLAVVPIVEENDVLQLSAAANSSRLVNASDLLLTSIANNHLEVDVMLNFAQSHMEGIERIAIVYRNDDFGNSILEIAQPMWEELGGEVAIAEGHEPDQEEFSGLATRVREADADAVYVGSSAAQQGMMVRQLREGGVDVPLLSYQGFEVEELFSVAGDAAQNSYWTSAARAEDSARLDEYEARFEERFGAESSIFDLNHYDLMLSLVAGMERVMDSGEPLTGANIRQAMIAMGSFEGVLGPFTYQEDGQPVRALDVRTYENGEGAIYMTASELEENGIYDFELAE